MIELCTSDVKSELSVRPQKNHWVEPVQFLEIAVMAPVFWGFCVTIFDH